MKQLVDNFVDGSEVDFDEMLSFGLIEKSEDGFVLTEYGRSFLSNDLDKVQ